MGQEYELKYQATPEVLSSIRDNIGGFAEIAMETVYYDTPDGALSRLRWTFRRRLENGEAVCTLKTSMPDGSRGEWEVSCADMDAAPGLLAEAGAPAALLSLTASGVVPVCGARFTRLAKAIALGDSVVELALDAGSLLGGGRELPFAEAEVELKQGRREDADRFAAGLSEKFGLVPEKKSKFKRALSLAREAVDGTKCPKG